MASHWDKPSIGYFCGNNVWATRRFVQFQEYPIQTSPHSSVTSISGSVETTACSCSMKRRKMQPYKDGTWRATSLLASRFAVRQYCRERRSAGRGWSGRGFSATVKNDPAVVGSHKGVFHRVSDYIHRKDRKTLLL